MKIGNDSTLYLLTNIPLDPNYNYTLDFETIQKQQDYFLSKRNLFLCNDLDSTYSYIRDSNKITVYFDLDTLIDYNYLMFKNADKWYYAFIVDKQRASDGATTIEFKIDVLQSFMFDYEIDESFVEREHQDRYDLEGYPIYNIETENIERGREFKRTTRYTIPDNMPDDFKQFVNQNKGSNLFWVTAVTKEPIGKKAYNNGGVITEIKPSERQTTYVKGMPTNVYTYIIPLWIGKQGEIEVSQTFVNCKASETADGSISVFNREMLAKLTKDPLVLSLSFSRYSPFKYGCVYKHNTPSSPIYYGLYPIQDTTSISPYRDPYELALTAYEFSTEKGQGYGGMFFVCNYIGELNEQVYIINHNGKIDLSTLNIGSKKNIKFETKLKTEDFNYYELEYGANKIKLLNEDLSKDNFKIKYQHSFSVKSGQAFIPVDYRGEKECYGNMLTCDSSTNEIALRTDAWLTYLAQNKASMVSGFVTGAIQTASSIGIGLGTGGMGLAVAGTQAIGYAGGVANKIAQLHDLKNQPDDVKDTSLDSVLNFATKDIYLTLNEYEIKESFKNKAFNYLYHFGYVCNDFKKPNTKSRYYFNYIKTIGCNIKTNLSENFRQEIANIYDNGVTIWHLRDINTFKGVNNYDYENVEMKLMGGTNEQII